MISAVVAFVVTSSHNDRNYGEENGEDALEVHFLSLRHVDS